MPNPVGVTIRNLGQMAAAITQRMQAALFEPPSNTIESVNPSNWPSALQPVSPIGPPGSQPLGFNLRMGQNLIYTPRFDAEYSAKDLRMFGRYPLARYCIENVKDTICKYEWDIHPKAKVGESHKDRAKRAKGDDMIVKLSRFWEYPDGEHDWAEWLRPILEDMLVIDAASILIERTRSKEIVGLRYTPGQCITRYVDDRGFTPAPPSPAYAQLWEGIPRVDLTTDQLVYKPRNIVPRESISSYLYGMAPTEQGAKDIEIGIARLLFVYAYYKEGSIPDVVHIVPPDVPTDRIREAMDWMNSELAGNLAKRQQWRMIQGFQSEGRQDQVIFPKEKLLSDPFDEIHIRKICFAYGVSPQRLLHMMNRATAQTNQEAAEEEGTLPFIRWVLSVANYIMQRKMGAADYEMSFQEEEAKDRFQGDASDAQNCIVTRNEIREDRGLDPLKIPGMDTPGIIGPTGFVPVDQQIPDPMEMAQMQMQMKQQSAPGQDGQPGKPKPPETDHFGLGLKPPKAPTAPVPGGNKKAEDEDELAKAGWEDVPRDEHGRWESVGGKGALKLSVVKKKLGTVSR
jgi:hypothetical protein